MAPDGVTYHHAFGLFVHRFLHEAGQLTQVLLGLLQQAGRRVTVGRRASLKQVKSCPKSIRLFCG